MTTAIIKPVQVQFTLIQLRLNLNFIFKIDSPFQTRSSDDETKDDTEYDFKTLSEKIATLKRKPDAAASFVQKLLKWVSFLAWIVVIIYFQTFDFW